MKDNKAIVTINDVEILLNKKFGILLKEFAQQNDKLKDDIRKELIGIQQKFNDTVKELINDISEVERLTDDKLSKQYQLIGELEEQIRQERAKNELLMKPVEQATVSTHYKNEQINDLQVNIDNTSWRRDGLSSTQIKYIPGYDINEPDNDTTQPEYNSNERREDYHGNSRTIELVHRSKSGKAIIAKHNAWDVTEA